jgi:hypothetical protein
MIQASIVPTRCFRDSGSTPDRNGPTQLRNSQNATAENPVVLVRGCTPIDLRVISSIPSSRVTWEIKGLKSNGIALVPKLFPPVSMFSRLSTDAVGLYRVTATIAAAAGLNVQHHWHVRFIDLRVPDDPAAVDNGALDISYHPFTATVDAGALFGFTIKVVLSGAEDAAHQYDKVTIGILQNLFQKSDDPGCKELHGIYYRYDGPLIKRGELAEPSPAVRSPHLDAQVNCEEFPFMHTGHVTVDPTTGSERSIKLWDEPGVTLPLYFDTAGSPIRRDWKSKCLSLEEAKKCQTHYALCGVGGCLNFISAVAAFSTEAKLNHVVFEKYDFIMKAKAMAPEENLQKKGYPFGDPKDLGIPNSSPCFELVSYSRLGTPADAKDAGMETYGPVATDGGNRYVWKEL